MKRVPSGLLLNKNHIEPEVATNRAAAQLLVHPRERAKRAALVRNISAMRLAE
jgi:hypothetical protein